MHLHAQLPRRWDWIAGSERAPSSRLMRRTSDQSRDIFIGIFAAVLVILIIIIAVCVTRRRNLARRGSQKPSSRSSTLDRVLSFWPQAGSYHQTSGDDSSHPLNSTSGGRNVTQRPTATARTAAGVDRNTSIRSIMTLPPYRPSASHTEQVLGREGERGGVDVVVDFPTEEDQEALREEEMDTLYQIRQARRHEIAERGRLRAEREAAQRRGDVAALADIRARSRAASSNSLVRDLRTNVDQIKDNRQRSVSTVSYADLGVASHDGTRLRASSQESERMGLLSDAASIAAVSTRSGAHSPGQLHQRGRSTGSVVSIDSDFPPAAVVRSHGDSRASTPRLSSGGARAGSSPELVEADLGDEHMAPPGYEDVSLDDDDDSGRESIQRSATPLTRTPPNEPPPTYSGPHSSSAPYEEASGGGGAPQLPSLQIPHLPEIVIEPSTAHTESHE